MIFDAIARTDASPKLNIESDFEFLNRSARDEMQCARSLLESLATEYPDSGELIARFRSGNNKNYRSAEFELLLFSMLHKQGFKLQPHPILPNGSRARPDFLVTTPSGEEFYLEAVLASEDGADNSGHPLIANTLDVFTSHSHKNFCVMVKTSGLPKTQPRRRVLLSKTLHWLDSLDPDLTQEQIAAHGYDSAPSMSWVHEDFKVTVSALPLKTNRRGKASRLLAVRFGQAGWIDSWSGIRDAIKHKGSKYGLLDKPLVIAVNFSGHHLDRMDEMQALFGQEQISIPIGRPDAAPVITRAPNGAWIGVDRPRFTRVSGAWLFDNLCVYNLPSRDPTLYLHPFARQAVPSDMLRFSHAVGVNGNISWVPGMSLAEIFELSADWPRGC